MALHYVILIHPFEQIKKEPYSSYKSGGQGWIRTTVVSRRQIYSLLPLATRAPTHIKFSSSPCITCQRAQMPLTGFEPVASPLPRECATPAPQRLVFKVQKAGNRNRTYNLRFTKPLLYR